MPADVGTLPSCPVSPEPRPGPGPLWQPRTGSGLRLRSWLWLALPGGVPCAGWKAPGPRLSPRGCTDPTSGSPGADGLSKAALDGRWIQVARDRGPRSEPLKGVPP